MNTAALLLDLEEKKKERKRRSPGLKLKAAVV